jgi:uncharacterized membrane protein YjjB (DUF3815 family)
MIGQAFAAFFGTVAFSVLFSVPRKYYPYCGAIGCVGWMCYLILQKLGLTATESIFFATMLVVLVSRFCAVWERCPVTVFLITGIFPLVPGGGIYWTAYYLVTSQYNEAISSGLTALKAAVAIVLGIVMVFELPYSFFRVKSHNKI